MRESTVTLLLLGAALSASACVSKGDTNVTANGFGSGGARDDGGSTGGGGARGSGGAKESGTGGADGSGGDAPGSGGRVSSGGAAGGGGTGAGGGKAAECAENDECGSGFCDLPDGKCLDLRLDGTVRRFEDVDPTPRGLVKVAVTNMQRQDGTPIVSNETGSDGVYAIENLVPGTLFNLELQFEEYLGDWKVSTAMRTRQSAVRQGSEEKVNPVHVSVNWLVQTAVECGVFGSMAQATGGDAGFGIDASFIQRSVVMGTIANAQGQPVAGVPRGDVSIRLGTFVNTHLTSEDDSGVGQPFLCFLGDSNKRYVGTDSDVSTNTGRFVMFRVRNETNTGSGLAEVSVPGYPAANVVLKSSGNIGIANIGASSEVPPLPRPRTFELDVKPLFREAGCVACHSPLKGPGFLAKPKGAPADVAADWSGTDQEVYDRLMARDADAGACGPDAPARVCLTDPESSLLIQRPLTEVVGKQDHDNSSFDSLDDPRARAILEWIEQGAPGPAE